MLFLLYTTRGTAIIYFRWLRDGLKQNKDYLDITGPCKGKFCRSVYGKGTFSLFLFCFYYHYHYFHPKLFRYRRSVIRAGYILLRDIWLIVLGYNFRTGKF